LSDDLWATEHGRTGERHATARENRRIARTPGGPPSNDV
jgi:hypothetical protein